MLWLTECKRKVLVDMVNLEWRVVSVVVIVGMPNAAHRDMDGLESVRSGAADGVEKVIIMLCDVIDGYLGWSGEIEPTGSTMGWWGCEKR